MPRIERQVVIALTVALIVALEGCGDTRSTAAPAANTTPSTTSVPVERLRVKVLASFPHDTTAFTEGLVFDSRDDLYESTGEYGRSTIRRVEPTTGAVLSSVALEPDEFGEGIAMGTGRSLVQLTWKERRSIDWNLDTLERGRTVSYEGEGWGLTSDADNARFVMSNGSSTLTFRDINSFAVLGTVQVELDGVPLSELNELEEVGEVVWANVWQTDEIVRIDPVTGHVTAVVDASGLLDATRSEAADVLNGVAHRPGDPDDVLWITGKRWPTMFQVQLVPA